MKVTLVGAGPGDKGLLTFKGYSSIRKADVVLYDRHVSNDILAMVPETAELVDVGKNAGSHPIPQDEINHLLIEHVKKGRNVVRLKGGDPFVFGRGGEELEFLHENNVPFEVVPGVTSAIAGAAYAGIPVTHRDYVSSLHIITGHGKKDTIPDTDYDALVRTGGTLVFMMGVAAVAGICAGLVSAGMDADMPAAVIEKATTKEQRKFLGTVGNLPEIVRSNSVISPSVIIIGKVCLLSERLDWLSRKPLSGKRIIVAQVNPGSSKLSSRLEELGCQVIELPIAKIAPLTGSGCDLDKALKRIIDFSWLVFTSGVGADIFFDHLFDTRYDIRALHHLKIACVGTETEKTVNKRGVKVDFVPSVFNGVALAGGLAKLVMPGERVLITRDRNAAKDFTQILSKNGITYYDVATYEKTTEKVYLKDINADFATFTSSSGVEGFARAAGNADLKRIKAVCIGEKTAAAALSHGMEVFISEVATIDGVIKKIQEICV